MDKALQEQLQAIRREYVRNLPDKMQEIRNAWEQLLQSPNNEELLRELHRLVHKLTGSGKTFGFADISQEAYKLEYLLKPALENPTSIVRASDIYEYLTNLEKVCQAVMISEREVL